MFVARIMTSPTFTRLRVLACGVLALVASPSQAAFRASGFELVHTAPVGTTLAMQGVRDPVTVWCEMINQARHSIDFEQFYIAGKSGEPLDRVLAALEAAGRRGVAIRFLMEKQGVAMSDTMTLNRLKRIPGIDFRLLAFADVAGEGIIHAKFFVVDGRQAFVGSHNFDWRALKHIDETGLRFSDRRMVEQLQAIFAQDWAAQARIQSGGKPMPLRQGDDTDNESRKAYLVASPSAFNPPGVGDSQAALVRLIGEAEHDIRVEVMEYAPLARNGAPYRVIDDALRAAAARGVHIRLMIADWSLTKARIPAIESLSRVPNVEIRVATIPQIASGPIPYARVVHTKIMTVDGDTAWVGTSNWEGGYLDTSRNVEVVLRNRAMAKKLDRQQDRLWTSPYAVPLAQAVKMRAAP
jgi:phosphatidylserine/phosphatidylglycerophosphate/cardiolipin synthase-like enzyme